MTNTTINFLISDWDEKNKRHYSNCVETKAKQDAANALDGLFTQTLSPNPLSTADFSGIGALREEFLHQPSVDTSFRDSQTSLSNKIAALTLPSLNLDSLLATSGITQPNIQALPPSSLTTVSTTTPKQEYIVPVAHKIKGYAITSLVAIWRKKDPNDPLFIKMIKDFTPSEQKEFQAYYSKLIDSSKWMNGALINTAALPIAWGNIAFKKAMAFLYEGIIHTAAVDYDPYSTNLTNYRQIQTSVIKIHDFLEGRDSGYPNWITAIGKSFYPYAVEFNRQLEALDADLHQKFGTTQGRIKEAAEGTINTALAVLPVPGFSTAKKIVQMGLKNPERIFKGIENLMQIGKNTRSAFISLKDAQEIRLVSKALTEPSRFAAEFGCEELFSLDARISHAAWFLTDYAIPKKNAVLDNISKNFSFRIQEILTPVQAELSSLERGASGNAIYFMKNDNKISRYVMKIFYNAFKDTQRFGGQFGEEVAAYSLYNRLGLKNIEFPLVHKIGKFSTPNPNWNNGFIIMDYVNGRSLATQLEELSLLENSGARSNALFQFSKAIEQMGRALAELHNKSVSLKDFIPSNVSTLDANWLRRQFLEKEASSLRTYFAGTKNIFLEDLKLSNHLSENKIQNVIDNLLRTEEPGCFLHGDIHLDNFYWNNESLKLYAFDPGTLVQSINNELQPIGIAAKDYMQFHAFFEIQAENLAINPPEISYIFEAFQKGYHSEFIGVHSRESLEFYRRYWELFRLNNMIKYSIADPRHIFNLLAKIEAESTARPSYVYFDFAQALENALKDLS